MTNSENSTTDVNARIDSGAWGTYQKSITALAALAVIFDGFDIQILAFAIPSLIREWHVARAAFGPVLAMGLAGMTVGGPLAGYAGDRWGRRPALIGSVALFGIATVATSFVDGLVSLAALRFLTGVGGGGAMPNAAAMVSEFAPARRRPMAVKLTIVCVPLGGMLGGLIAAQVLPSLGGRALYAIGGTAPLAFAAALAAVLPESPRFLARRRGRWEELKALMGRMGLPVSSGTLFRESFSEREDYSPTQLFVPALLRDTTGLWLAFFSCLGSIYLVFGWLPTFLASQGLAVGPASNGLAVYNFGGVLGVLILTGVVTLTGSRMPMLLFSLAASASAAALVPVALPANAAVATVWIGVNGLFANAVQTALYAVAAHVYPTSVRSTGVAWCAAIGRAGALLSSLFGAYVIQAGGGAYWWTLSLSMVVTFGGLTLVRNHIPAGKKKAVRNSRTAF